MKVGIHNRHLDDGLRDSDVIVTNRLADQLRILMMILMRILSRHNNQDAKAIILSDGDFYVFQRTIVYEPSMGMWIEPVKTLITDCIQTDACFGPILGPAGPCIDMPVGVSSELIPI